MILQQTRWSLHERVATITLHRPEAMNAFTPTMMEELVSLFERASDDDEVRAVVVTGEGRAFCAGADLARGGETFDSARRGAAHGARFRDGGGRVALAIFGCRKPVIAAINGAAVGVGITMTLPMDVRIVSEDAKVGFVFARRGIVTEACSSWFLPRIVGIAKAAEWCLTGRVFKASDEAASGLFNHVVAAGGVVAKATEIAREIADNTSAVSVALNRALLWRGLGVPDPQTVHLSDSRCIQWAGAQRDAYEGVASFLEKRPPRFEMSARDDLPDFYPWWTEPKV